MRVHFVVVFIDIQSNRFIEEPPYVAWLVSIIEPYVNLRDDDYATHSLDYVSIPSPFDQHHLLKTFEFRLTETILGRRLQLEPQRPLFGNRYFEDFVTVSLIRRYDLIFRFSNGVILMRLTA